MRNILQITFCVLSCLCIAATVLVGALCGFIYCLIPLGGAALFMLLMLFMKNGGIKPKAEPHADFMNSEEENNALNENDKEQ